MKHKIFCLIFCFSAIAVSCNKDEIKSPYTGFVKANLNGQKWKANVYAEYNNNCNIGRALIHFNLLSNNALKESLIVYNFSLPSRTRKKVKGGKFLCKDSSITAYYGKVVTDDGPGDNYIVLDTTGYDNYFEITDYDPRTGYFKGNFQVTFVFDTTYGNKIDPADPDTIRFTEGVFETKIQDPDPFH